MHCGTSQQSFQIGRSSTVHIVTRAAQFLLKCESRFSYMGTEITILIFLHQKLHSSKKIKIKNAKRCKKNSRQCYVLLFSVPILLRRHSHRQLACFFPTCCFRSQTFKLKYINKYLWGQQRRTNIRIETINKANGLNWVRFIREYCMDRWKGLKTFLADTRQYLKFLRYWRLFRY